jgi:hypothetical protein
MIRTTNIDYSGGEETMLRQVILARNSPEFFEFLSNKIGEDSVASAHEKKYELALQLSNASLKIGEIANGLVVLFKHNNRFFEGNILYPGGVEQLATDWSNLRYDKLASLCERMADLLKERAKTFSDKEERDVFVKFSHDITFVKNCFEQARN